MYASKMSRVFCAFCTLLGLVIQRVLKNLARTDFNQTLKTTLLQFTHLPHAFFSPSTTHNINHIQVKSFALIWILASLNRGSWHMYSIQYDSDHIPVNIVQEERSAHLMYKRWSLSGLLRHFLLGLLKELRTEACICLFALLWGDLYPAFHEDSEAGCSMTASSMTAMLRLFIMLT